MSAVSIIVMFFHLILSLNVIGIQIQNMCVILDKYVSGGDIYLLCFLLRSWDPPMKIWCQDFVLSTRSEHSSFFHRTVHFVTSRYLYYTLGMGIISGRKQCSDQRTTKEKKSSPNWQSKLL